jgi:hypothetical protein
MMYGLRFVVYGVRFTAPRLRLMAYGLRLTAYSLQLTAYGLRLVAYSLLLTAYGLRLTTYGLRPTVIAYGPASGEYMSLDCKKNSESRKISHTIYSICARVCFLCQSFVAQTEGLDSPPLSGPQVPFLFACRLWIHECGDDR